MPNINRNSFLTTIFGADDDKAELIPEERLYQSNTFVNGIKPIAVISVILISLYFYLAITYRSVPATILGTACTILFGISVYGIRTTTPDNFRTNLRLFLASATFVIFCFGTFQTIEFTILSVLGVCLIISFCTLLETERGTYFWVITNIAIYLITLVLHNYVELVPWPSHTLINAVTQLTPIMHFVVLAILGQATIRHFKITLLHSKQRREQLEAQEVQLRLTAANLARSNRELQDFAYVASHDLQEPLRKINAFGSRIKKTMGDNIDEQSNDYLNRMLNAGTRMQMLIEDLLAYSRITTKPHPFTLVDLNHIVEETMVDLELTIEQSEASIEIKQLPKIIGDKVNLKQLFQNLINNSIKYSKKDVPTKIQIYSEAVLPSNTPHENQSYRIYVVDNGIGFDNKYSERIFGVFQRLHGRNEYEGSGIGLAICSKIVDRHSGTIQARGEDGIGATFIITLPYQPIIEEAEEKLNEG